MVGLEFSIDLI